MAAVFTSLILLVLGHSFAGQISARSVELADGQADATGDVTEIEDMMTSDTMTSEEVLCDVAGCSYDLQLYCLTNGIIVMGSCSLKNLLCTNGERNSLRLAQNWDECFQATYVIAHHQMNTDEGDNSDQSLQQDHTNHPLNTQLHSLLQADQPATGSETHTEGDDATGQESDRVVDLLTDLEEQLDQVLDQ